MMMKKLIVRADRSDDPSVRRDFVTNGLESGMTMFILRKEDENLAQLGKMEVIYTENGRILDDAYEMIDIDDPDSQSKAMSLAGKKKAVMVTTSDWTIIPLENMIAKFGGTGTEVYTVTSDPEDTKLFLTTMEKGVDGIVIDVKDPLMVRKFGDKLSATGKETLSEVTVTSIKAVEMGDRVCIDTCSMMVPGEGMLIGSYSNCLFLIQSESEENGYVASRPFRVNAGAVHSYMEVPGGGTRYLSEISAGDPVLLCDREGNTRVASVGRCKIEKRPLLMVTATDGKREYTVMLQNAETIKMVGPEGAKSVTKVVVGDKLLAKLDTGGRHFGMAIEETISEK
ncbi:MAG: 3-dehydroquinate synthase II [Candidatus Methanomethylophilaceae archaeon]|nr:3-dehydroquinate synthase II [Candidatus Methanomethylophilaceae archaeon]